MVTVHRETGLQIVIYLEDHEPAHVHVLGDGEAKINLLSASGEPEIVRSQQMSFGVLRKALRIVRKQQAFLLARWSEIHG
jgi:hypothetical protein